MAIDSITGQDLVDGTNARLMGLQNAFSPEVLLSYINEGKDEIWTVLKNLNTEYFITPTVTTPATAENYFPAMNVTTREYALPKDLREISFIECISPGFEQTVFVYRKITDEDFRTSRRSANVDATLTPTIQYFYSIVGKNTFILAQFPEFPFVLKLWYVRSLPDLDQGAVLDEILYPYSKKIEDYAVKKAVLSSQDQAQFQAWTAEWKADLLMVATSGGPRNQADPEFVQDFLG